jgi:putative ABC transport system substrate-binding protein
MNLVRVASRSAFALGMTIYCTVVIASQTFIGFVAPDEEPRYTNLMLGMRQGLQREDAAKRDLTIVEYRIPRRDAAAARRAAESLRIRGVSAAFVVGTELTRSLRSVIKELPIIFITPGNPVRPGLAASLAHPGNNMTGMTFEFPELSAKRLEMLKEINPATLVVGVVYDPRDRSPRQGFAAAKEGARKLGLQLVEIDVESLRAGQTPQTPSAKLDGLILLPGGAITTVATAAIRLATTLRIVSVVWARSEATQDAILSYGVNDVDVARDAARLVMRVVNGYPAGNLPIERPSRFELVVNRKAAKAIGVTLPPEIMVRADRVIE